MAIEFLNANTAYTLVNESYKQAAGENALATENLNDFIDGGIAHDDLGKYRDLFTKALLVQGVKNVFLDAAYKRAKEAGFRVEDMNFDAILQAITFDIPEAQASHAWQDFTDPLNPATVGTYTVKFAGTNAKLYGKTTSWELQYDYSGEQMDDAFKSEESALAYLGALRLNIANAIEFHDEVLDDVLRNAVIANLLNADLFMDLRNGYNTEMAPSTPIRTREQFYANADCLKYMSRKISEIKGYMIKPSKLLNPAGRLTFTPNDRIKLQILNYAEQAFNSVAQSGTFHEQFTSLPGYEPIPYWQAPSDGDSIYNPDVLSAINVLPEGGTEGEDEVVADGVVALLADRWSAIHAVRLRRSCSIFHEPEDLYQNFIQFRDNRSVLDTQNGFVFLISNEMETIKFNSNGGSTVADMIVKYGTVATAPTAPTKAGKTFGGWYSDENLTTAVDWTQPVTAGATYYAKWDS